MAAKVFVKSSEQCFLFGYRVINHNFWPMVTYLSEAFIPKCFTEKQKSQSSQENTCAGVSF